MFNQIKTILYNEGIDRIGMIDIKHCDIINQRILPDNVKSAIIFCIPYRSTTAAPDDGFSEYARIYDYHKYASELYSRTVNLLSETTGFHFYGFCDHSPINEKLAAAKSGLGIIGRNSLFIDKIYGSFVFLGSILTDYSSDSEVSDIETCINCGKCVSACPNSAMLEHGIDRYKCLSGISQKKTKSDDEKRLLREHNIIWGCDICQLVCPYNINAKISPIPYFKSTRVPKIDRAFIDSLSDEEFQKYAFSYKGRKIVLDNIEFK